MESARKRTAVRRARFLASLVVRPNGRCERRSALGSSKPTVRVPAMKEFRMWGAKTAEICGDCLVKWYGARIEGDRVFPTR